MHKNVLVAIAIVAVVAIVVVLLMNKPPSEEKVYLYSVERGEATVVYIPLRDGAVFGVVDLYDFLVGTLDYLYYMSKDSGVVNEVAKIGDVYWKYTYFNRPGMLCKNYTATATIAGEKLTVANSRCRPSPAPLSKARSFDEVAVLTRQLYHYGFLFHTSQLHWQSSGTVQTPFGQATVYTSHVKIVENFEH
ncbi:MAG: hypothetical protein ACO2PN_21560, partial [Pyrobaculum sp.]